MQTAKTEGPDGAFSSGSDFRMDGGVTATDFAANSQARRAVRR